MPPAPRRSEGRRTLIGVVVFVVVLLRVNAWGASRIAAGAAGARALQPDLPDTGTGRQRRVRVVQGLDGAGEFRRAVRYPHDPNAKASHFATEVPTFANSDQLSALLEQKGVVVNAKPPSEGRSLLVRLLIACCPRC